MSLIGCHYLNHLTNPKMQTNNITEKNRSNMENLNNIKIDDQKNIGIGNSSTTTTTIIGDNGSYWDFKFNPSQENLFLPQSLSIDREQYERELKERQEQHLARVNSRNNQNWRPCMHDACTQCHGTGIKWDGSACFHMISCPCPKCTPYYGT